MEIEQIEILEFFRRHLPFQELPEEQLEQIALTVDVGYCKAGTDILGANEPIDALHVIRSGAVEVYRRNGELFNRLSEGGFFGEQGLLRGGKVRFPARAIEDTLIYYIPNEVFQQIFDENDFFYDYMGGSDKERLTTSQANRQAESNLLGTKISSLLTLDLVSIGSDANVWESAQLMTEHDVSSLLILKQGAKSNEPDSLVGIITDKDIRSRLVAPGLKSETLVTSIMHEDPVTVDGEKYVFEAVTLMLRYNLRHLPVLRQRVPIGVISISDIVRYESQHSLFVVSRIFRQQSVAELQELHSDVKACFVRMVNEDANSHMIGSAIAAIGRSFKQRLLELAEEQLGPPPVPYCFLALGSMARDEQIIQTDQDNALILDDSYDPSQHDEYFKELAKYVCDGLAACGYSYCTGNIMATNPQWRQPFKVWQQYFQNWIEQPSAERLLHSSIFFDINGVWGQRHWAKKLQLQVSKLAPKNPIFIASMTRNALTRTPPLGFFKDFVMEQDGKQNNSLNIKRRGTAPFADLIRTHALAIGSEASNSFDRLKDIAKADVLPKGHAADLRDAFEIIAMTRIRHQANAIEEGLEPDNNVLPENLSEFERKYLKEAFQTLGNAQKFLKFHFRA